MQMMQQEHLKTRPHTAVSSKRYTAPLALLASYESLDDVHDVILSSDAQHGCCLSAL